MNLDLGSFAFGSYIASGGGTPSWGTALGQSKPDYKFTYPGAEAILIGMVYCSVPLNAVSLPLGKGGRVYQASELFECQIASLFRKVYINGTRINYPFILVLVKEDSESHSGRKSIKYSDKNTYEYGKERYSNKEFVRQARLTLGIEEDACWFVYSFEIFDQDELHMSAVIVDENDSITYANSSERRNKWLDLIPETENSIVVRGKSNTYDNFPLQQIFYGAPGTGKSNTIKREIDENGKMCVRTTFHPDSDYSTFVGAYKPTMKENIISKNGVESKEEQIVYRFVPQAFTNAYVKAWNTEEDVFLVIEEINRGNCAQIFGDLFQLLDRKDGISEYPIDADSDLADYLKNELADSPRTDFPEGVKEGKKLVLPSNLYIWATMNTSDQSLFPIDSAFKRRWEWKYMPIKNHEQKNYKIEIGGTKYDWWGFLERINHVIGETTSSEDKKLGYFFAKAEDGVIKADSFVGKVLFYLWNDVFKNYGFDHEIFNKGDKKKFEFSDFFNADGTPEEKVVNQFLRKVEETIKMEDLPMEENEDVVDGSVDMGLFS